MTEPVAVGVLSVAHVHTEPYVSILADRPDVDLVGIAAEDGATARDLAERYDTTVRETDALLDAVDGVLVCSPNATHIDWIEPAADAGVDVLCEKPLAPTYDTAREIADICEDAGINAGLCMPLRFGSDARAAKAAVDEGRIGDVRYLDGTNRGKMPGSWFVDPELAGGGAVMDHTVHILNLVRWIMDQEVAEVYAETGTMVYDIPVEDVNLLSMELEDGTPFTLDGSWTRPENWDTWGDGNLEILGTEGTVTFDSTAGGIKLTCDSGENEGINTVGLGGGSNEGLLEDFVAAVREDRDPLTSVRDAANEVAVIEAAYESAERAEPVTVDY